MRTVITANRSGLRLNLPELLRYRDLLWLLAYRDYRVRYAQTFLGFAWAFVQPLLTMIVFILVFNKAAGVDTGDIPYPVFVMTGLWAWSYLSFVLTQGGQSLILSSHLITKVYFPRLLIPLAKSLVAFIDFSVTFVFLVVLMLVYQYAPSPNVITLPLWLLALIALSVSAGIWLSALTIRFRDIQHAIPFLVQIGLYFSPVAYHSSRVPEQYHTLFYLNPLAAIIDGFRWAVLGTPLPEFPYLAYSLAVIVLLLVSGLYYFKRTERIMADIL
ncbi:MAG: ABC transporter permease [Chitinophagales bacterium]|nr:ABC transporter permease [Chitinophagales bacterium]MDW8428116.1 ABC transporter permease [Chitinophagales bacterium]